MIQILNDNSIHFVDRPMALKKKKKGVYSSIFLFFQQTVLVINQTLCIGDLFFFAFINLLFKCQVKKSYVYKIVTLAQFARSFQSCC